MTLPTFHVRRAALAVLLAAGGLGSLSTAAVAAPGTDTAPPSLTLEPYGRYVVGNGTFHNSYAPGEGDYWTAKFVLRWTASDPSGICRQTITEQSYDTLGGEYDPILGWDSVTRPIAASARSFSYADDFFNNARVPHSFVIRATDCAGHTATSRIATTVVDAVEDTSPTLAYAGTWKTSSFSGFSEGTTHYSTARGASVTIPSDGGPVALVMEKAPNRGAADVYVDGVLRSTINTYSATAQHQALVWQSLLTDRAHTIKVVNRATAGHPRIDLDLALR